MKTITNPRSLMSQNTQQMKVHISFFQNSIICFEYNMNYKHIVNNNFSFFFYFGIIILYKFCTPYSNHFSPGYLFSHSVTSSVSKSFIISPIHRFLGLHLGFFPISCHSIADLTLVFSSFRMA